MLRKPKLVKQVLETLHVVLSRPRYGFDVTPIVDDGFSISTGVDTVHVSVRVEKGVLHDILTIFGVISSVDEEYDHYFKPFFYVSFGTSEVGKIRKCAIILAKKLSMKPMYDVMSGLTRG